jgi:peptide/nickel transport system substrate-binding protein
MKSGGTPVSRREFLGRAAALAGGVSIGLIGLRPSVAQATAAPTRAELRAPTLLQQGSSITVSMAERLLVLDPANHYSISTTAVLRHIFDPLIDVTSDSKFLPVLAESWQNPDPLTWRFKLRQDVTFHDGTPFDSSSVVYTIKRAATDKTLLKNSTFFDVTTVEPEGPYGVIVRSAHPFGSILGHLSALGMLPASAAGSEDAFFQNPIGTGPFRFNGWTRGETINLAANDNYWKSGSPKVQSARFRFIPEISTRAAGLQSGEIDIIDRIPADLVSTLQSTSGVQILTQAAIETQQWIFQLQRPPTNDVNVRKAISLGIDRETIIRDFHLGYAQTAVCPIPPGLVGWADLGAKPYDPDGARALLQATSNPSPTIDFVLAKGLYPKQLEIAQAVQAMLGDVGINLNVRELEVAAARDARSAGDYHLWYSGWAHLPHDADWYYSQWYTAAGASTLSRYNNPAVEQLVIEARSTDNSIRQAKYEQLERIIWNEEEDAIWPYNSTAVYGIRDRVSGFEARTDYLIYLMDVAVG